MSAQKYIAVTVHAHDWNPQPPIMKLIKAEHAHGLME